MKLLLQHLNGLAIISILTLVFGFKLGIFLLIVQFAIALILGYFFDVIDRAVQYLIGDAVSERAKIDTKEIAVHAQKLNWKNIHRISPITQSFWFLVAYFPLVIFVLSSTGSLVGAAFILGLGVRYAVILFQDLSMGQIQKSVFFDDAQIKFSPSELTKISTAFICCFVVLIGITWLRM